MFKQREKLVRWLPTLCLCLLGLLIYSNTFHASFHFDDEGSIINNPAIRNLWNLKAIWDFAPTRFFTCLSLAFNYRLHQLLLPGYHLFNLAIHLGAAMLVSWFVLLLLSTPAVKDSPVARHAKLISLLAGLIFVAHPIQTQAVTYIIQRTASLATFFYLLSVCLYLRARLNQAQKPDSPCWLRFYAGSILSASAALFTKETAITLPFMLLLCEVSFFRNNPKNIIKRLAPFFLVLLLVLITIKVTGSAKFLEMRTLRESQAGLTSITPSQYLFTQFRVILTYLRLLFFPVNQNLDYDYSIAQTLWQVPVVASLVFLLLLLTVGVLLFRKHRILSFSIFWFFLALVPESSIIPIKDVIFEHRLYLPMVGYCLFLPTAAYCLAGNKRWKSASILLLVIIACYSVMTYARNRVWKDEITLWSDVVKKSPNKARPYCNRGKALNNKGEYDRAIADYNQSLRIDPEVALTYNNRGVALYDKGEYDRAIADYNQSLRIDPEVALTYNNRGVDYYHKGEVGKAIDDYSRAITIQPNYADAYNNRGFSYLYKKEYDKAINDFNQAIRIQPNFQDAYNNRGAAYYAKGEHDKAVSDFQAAIKTGLPRLSSYYNLIKIFKKEGAEDKLMELYPKILKLKQDASIHDELGVLYSKRNMLDQALREFKSAVELKPTDARYRNNLGTAYMQKGERTKALECWEKALQLVPDLKEARENLNKAKTVNK